MLVYSLAWQGGKLGIQVNGLTLQNNFKTSDLFNRVYWKNISYSIFSEIIKLNPCFIVTVEGGQVLRDYNSKLMFKSFYR